MVTVIFCLDNHPFIWLADSWTFFKPNILTSEQDSEFYFLIVDLIDFSMGPFLKIF